MTVAATLLAFDYGERRIGVAVGQTITASANPVTTLHLRAGRLDWPGIEQLVQQWRPDALVVGLPINMDGSRHALAGRIERFVRQLHGRFGLPVHTIDERLSSHAAAAAGDQPGRDDIDARAAQIILETWLSDRAVVAHASRH